MSEIPDVKGFSSATWGRMFSCLDGWWCVHSYYFYSVSMDNTGGSPAWYLQWISVTYEDAICTNKFPSDKWIGGDESTSTYLHSNHEDCPYGMYNLFSIIIYRAKKYKDKFQESIHNWPCIKLSVEQFRVQKMEFMLPPLSHLDPPPLPSIYF